MRPPTERDQCQAKLDILIEGFMRADWTAYRDAAAGYATLPIRKISSAAA
jgi:hypothetical protein